MSQIDKYFGDMMISFVEEIEANEMHPLHETLCIVKKEHSLRKQGIEFNPATIKSSPAMREFMHDVMATYLKVKKANEDADAILLQLDEMELQNFIELQEVNRLTLLAVISKVDKQTVVKTKSNLARLAVMEKLKNDPKQLAIKEIKKEFENSTYPFNKRGYRAKFCKEMASKYPIIESIKTIERIFDTLNKSKNTTVPA